MNSFIGPIVTLILALFFAYKICETLNPWYMVAYALCAVVTLVMIWIERPRSSPLGTYPD